MTTRRELLAGLAGAATAMTCRTDKTFAAETSAGRMPNDPDRPFESGKVDLGTLFPLVRDLAAARSFDGSYLSGKFASFEEFRTAMRQRVFDTLLYRPEPVDPRPEVLERLELEDHFRERILFSTSPQFRVPAYVLIPKNLKGPAPAIVDLHSHGGMFLFGKEKVIDLGRERNHAVMSDYHQRNYDGRPTATELVRRGFVVISIDAFMFGERRVMLEADAQHGWNRANYSPDVARQLNMVCRGKESTIVKGLTLAGLTWPGIVFWDDIRTVDYLVTRPEVDPKRIGCVGISMGGYRSIYLTGLDDRIRAGCVVGFMSTVRPMIKAHLDTHSFVHFLPALHAQLDWPDVLTLAGQRNVMVQQCSRDGLFPLAGMQESVEKIAAVFDKLGRRDHFQGRFYDEPHRYTLAMQDEAFSWFEKVLK